MARPPFKREAEKRFPYKVDIPAPEGGLGSRLDAMQQWCRHNVGQWAYQSHTERGQVGERFRYFARFYFTAEEDADAFKWEWGRDAR